MIPELDDLLEIKVKVELVHQTTAAVLFYDKCSDLEHWIGKSLIKTNEKDFNFRKGKKMIFHLPEWWVKLNKVGPSENK